MSKRRNQRASQEDILAYANAVYDGYGELALASFTEKAFLVDGTKKIREQQTELARYREALGAIARINIDSPSPEPLTELVFLAHKVLEIRGIARRALTAAPGERERSEPTKLKGDE